MAYTYHELKEKTIQDLREIAKDVKHDAVQGFSQMNKGHLLPALCKALGIEMHEHLVVVGIDKPAIKEKMRELRKQRDAAREKHDHELLHGIRRQIHRLNRQIRAHVSHQPTGSTP
jgi:DNA-binding IclR family transcriptional regulator